MLTDKERAIRQKLKDDFAHYANKCLKISTKDGNLSSFELNKSQLYIHQCIEEQLKKTGKVRAIIVKSRQIGASTYTEGRFYWKTTHRKGVKAFILTHKSDSTSALYDMVKRYHEHVPLPVRPQTSKSNAKELVFNKLDSGYKLGTAGSDSVGRGMTIQYFHGSEVAYWPNEDEIVAGVLQAVPNSAGSEVILESTANGQGGLFHEMAMKAKEGVGDYRLIFVPWFWQEEYKREVPEGFVLSAEEESYKTQYNLSDEQIVWRRFKIYEFVGGISQFRREYPASVEEAFMADVEGALWTREMITENRLREFKTEDEIIKEMSQIVVSVDPSITNNSTSDEVGIVVVGTLSSGVGVVLADYSMKAHVEQWSKKVVEVYHHWEADYVLAETNQGGDMVQTIIKSVDRTVAYQSVHANRDKWTRAQPIAHQFTQGRAKLWGEHSKLEDEMTTWLPGKPSPNRLDAMVHGLTKLLLKQDTATTVQMLF
jgi:hypothetical protein